MSSKHREEPGKPIKAKTRDETVNGLSRWRRADLLAWSKEHGVQLVAYGSLGGSDGIVGSCFRALGLRGFWVWVFLDFCVLQVPHARMFPGAIHLSNFWRRQRRRSLLRLLLLPRLLLTGIATATIATSKATISAMSQMATRGLVISWQPWTISSP